MVERPKHVDPKKQLAAETLRKADFEFGNVLALHGRGVPSPEREHRFHPKRKFSFDFAWVDKKVAVEIEGGIHRGGRHTRGSGYQKDMEKYNEGQILGWVILRFSYDDLNRRPDYVVDQICRGLGVELPVEND